jgi:DNA topoisomerase-1
MPPEFDAAGAEGRRGDQGPQRAESKQVLADLERATFVVSSVAQKERKKNPRPPFITSKLQQASRFP